jgi:hypothetical protein
MEGKAVLHFRRAHLALSVVASILVLLSPGSAEAGCPAGWDLTPAGYCSSPECGTPMRCDGPCDYCAGKRGGPFPGEAVPPCNTCWAQNVCTCCVRKLSCWDKLPPGTGTELYERNFDRPGQDYKSFDIDSHAVYECESACNVDAKCKAWTYVKAGVQGANARCWLKTGVPELKSNLCCVSGLKAGICDSGSYWDAAAKACLPKIH